MIQNKMRQDKRNCIYSLLLRLPAIILLIVDCLTPNCLAKFICDKWRGAFRIRSISIGVSFAFQWFEPNGILFLDAASRTLSALVPTKIWSGLTHLGLSHLWHKTSFGPNGPLKTVYATRWARCDFPSNQTNPYPSDRIPPIHSQHPFGGYEILAKSLSLIGMCLTVKSSSFPVRQWA